MKAHCFLIIHDVPPLDLVADSHQKRKSTVNSRRTPWGPALTVRLKEVSGLYIGNRGNLTPVVLKLNLFAMNTCLFSL